MLYTCQKVVEEPRRTSKFNQGLGGDGPRSSSGWRHIYQTPKVSVLDPIHNLSLKMETMGGEHGELTNTLGKEMKMMIA